MPFTSTEKLAELIHQKCQIAAQLFKIGQRQTTTIEAENTNALLKLLSAKQHLISALQSLENELKPFQNQDPESRQWRSPEQRALSAKEAEQTNQLMAEVIRMEKQNELVMTKRRDEVAQQLQQVNNANQASNAYESNNSNTLDQLPKRNPIHTKHPTPGQTPRPITQGLDLTS